MASSGSREIIGSIQEKYESLNAKGRLSLLREVSHEWTETASDKQLRKRIVSWSRRLSPEECSKITGREVPREELKETRAAIGALAVLDNSEAVREVSRKVVSGLCLVEADREEMMQDMLRDLPLDSLKAMYIER